MIDLEKNKSFCPYVFKAALLPGYDTKSSVSAVPCCRFESNAHPEHEQDIIEKQTSMHNYDESYFKLIREKMVKGQKVAGCWKCYKEETNRGTSMRTQAINSFSQGSSFYPKWQRSFGPIGSINEIVKPELTYLEIESGRFCNLKCRSCSPNLSTSWDEDLVNEDVLTNFFGPEGHGTAEEIKKARKQNEDLVELTYEQCKNLNGIKITGGEPFLTDTVTIFLSRLVEWGLAENIELEVFTNCSFFPKEKYREILPKFRLVTVRLSLDAVKEKADFLRKKSNWNVVQKVASFWSDFCFENKNVKVKISHTISIFNVLYYYEFLKWSEEIFKRETSLDILKEPNIDKMQESHDFLVGFHFTYGPDYLCISNFSNKVKEKILSYVKNLKADADLNLKSQSRQSYDRYISAVEGTIKGKGQDMKSIFETKTEMFDLIRKENWKQTFPELAGIIDG